MDKNLFLLLLISIGILLKKSYCTCVLDSSELGVSFICKFKKTGLFRVRNLGGIQAHIDFGFEAADAIRFKNSYANTDISARRSIQNPITFNQKNNVHYMDISTIPPFKPMPKRSEINKMNKIMQIMKPIMNNEKIKTTITDENLLSTKTIKNDQNFTLSNTSIDILESAIMSHQQQMKYDHFKPALKIKTSLTSSMPIQMPYTLKTTKNNVITQMTTTSPSPILMHNEFQPKSSMVTVTMFPDLISTSLTNRPPMIFNDILSTINERTQSISRKNFIQNNSNFNVIMNAPREYYPFGYDKNFDDNFTSRIELPKTSFRCGDQKYFPGLYTNEEFGCMVFHVCALTDNGLIMKSFLCPESTLFDQSILKCNWWFYVDCKKSKHLYDSNIPISKSYQLMKALTFFSSYKSNEN